MHRSMHIIFMTCSVGCIIIGLTIVRRIIVKTWQWKKSTVTFLADNNDKDFAFKNIIHGEGEGEASLGTTMELVPTMATFLFVSLIR